MKRNLDVARAILLAVEQHDGSPISSDDILVGDHERDLIRYIAQLLLEKRYIEGRIVQYLDDRGPSQVNILRLTWAGHDFLDVARSEDTWSDAKKRAGKVGGTLTFELMKELLVSIVKERLGLPAG